MSLVHFVSRWSIDRKRFKLDNDYIHLNALWEVIKSLCCLTVAKWLTWQNIKTRIENLVTNDRRVKLLSYYLVLWQKNSFKHYKNNYAEISINYFRQFSLRIYFYLNIRLDIFLILGEWSNLDIIQLLRSKLLKFYVLKLPLSNLRGMRSKEAKTCSSYFFKISMLFSGTKKRLNSSW